MSPVPDVPPIDTVTEQPSVSRAHLAQIAADRWVTDGGSLLPPATEREDAAQSPVHDSGVTPTAPDPA